MTEEKIAELLKIHELNHHKAQILIQQKAKLRVLETLCVATHITNPLYKKEEEMTEYVDSLNLQKRVGELLADSTMINIQDDRDGSGMWIVTHETKRGGNKMIATCIEDNDGESHVLHEVRQTIDCVTYSIMLSAEAPDLALKIAREIPLTYWKVE